jgi:hypothetical protein
MTWLPDWRLPRLFVELYSDDEDYWPFYDNKVDVVQEGKDLYRLYDIPYCDNLRWGDLIRAEPEFNRGKKKPSSISFIEIVERAEHEFTQGEFLVGKTHAGLILDAIMAAGGFWAADSLMRFDVIVPASFDIDQWEKENRHIIEAGGWEDTQYDRWIKNRIQEQKRLDAI